MVVYIYRKCELHFAIGSYLMAILCRSLLELSSSKQEVFFMAHDPTHPEEV